MKNKYNKYHINISNYIMENKHVMYILINNDLKMSSGKIASQVGHVVQLIIEEIVSDSYEKFTITDIYNDYIKWKKDCVKIVLKASDKQMQELIKHKKARYIIDNGLTQVEPNSLTAIAFFPCNDMHDFFKDYKLL